jgi:hypothetical protein
MKKLAIKTNNYPLGGFDLNPRTGFVTEDDQVYILGVNLNQNQIQNVNGGINKGGDTYLYVKDSRLIQTI